MSIKPDWQSEDGTVQLYCGDCLEIMPKLEPGLVRMIWTDPPYGHGNHDGDYNSRLNTHRGLADKPIANDSPESMRVVLDGVLIEASRVLAEDCCCCCCCCCGGGGPRPTFAWLAERMDRDGLSFFHSVIWDKRNPGLGHRYRRQHEMIMVAHRNRGRLSWGKEASATRNVIDLGKPRTNEHPNIKPVDLVRPFVLNHSDKGEIVLDPFMGSGTTGVACVQLGRRFIGIEIEPKYFQIAVDRIQTAIEVRDSSLFKPEEFEPVQGELV